MSGTAYGTVILHCAPEAAVGGPLALVHDGDIIDIDVEKRILHLRVEEEELERRRRAWVPPELPSGGYQRLYCERVMQANLGADFDFLIGTRGHAVPRPSH
jgi:L-arabonate dehydrase